MSLRSDITEQAKASSEALLQAFTAAKKLQESLKENDPRREVLNDLIGKAIERRGCASSQAGIGNLLFQEQPVNHEAVLYWFQRAARQGHRPSRYRLAVFFRDTLSSDEILSTLKMAASSDVLPEPSGPLSKVGPLYDMPSNQLLNLEERLAWLAIEEIRQKKSLPEDELKPSIEIFEQALAVGRRILSLKFYEAVFFKDEKVVQAVDRELEALRKRWRYRGHRSSAVRPKRGSAVSRTRSEKRKSLSDALGESFVGSDKAKIRTAFGDQCFKCGSEANLQVDHHYPLSRKHPLSLKNATLLCAPCNQRKSAKLPEDFYTQQELERRSKIIDKLIYGDD